MVVLETNELYRVADSVLTAVSVSAADLGVTLPARQLLTAGAVVYDCELVAVTVVSVGTGITHAVGNAMVELAPQSPAWSVIVGVAIARQANEVPGGRQGNLPPTPANIEADLVSASADAAVLAGAAAALAGFGPGRAGLPDVNLTFQGAEGGILAVTMQLTLNPWNL